MTENEYKNIILYYEYDNDTIVSLIKDDSKLERYAQSNELTDAPVRFLSNTQEEKSKIIENMYQIKSWDITNNNKIILTFMNGEVIYLSEQNKDIILKVLLDQNEFNRKKYYITNSQNSAQRKLSNNKKIIHKLADFVASISLSTDVLDNKITENIKISKTSELDENSETSQNIEKYAEKIKALGKKLYNEVNKNKYLLQYQYVLQIKWDENLAIKIVQLLNGNYPDNLTKMNEEQIKKEIKRVLNQLNMLVVANSYAPRIDDNELEYQRICFADYVLFQEDKMIINNAQVLCDKVFDLSAISSIKFGDESKQISEQIISKEKYKFKNAYVNDVNTILNYEYDTLNSEEFNNLSLSTRYLVETLFSNVNCIIPKYSYIIRTTSEDKKKSKIFYRYFVNHKNGYVCEPCAPNDINSDEETYKCTYVDEDGITQTETYTKDEMFALAGLTSDEDAKKLSIKPNSLVYQDGIEIQLESNRDSLEQMLVNFIFVNSKKLEKTSESKTK